MQIVFISPAADNTIRAANNCGILLDPASPLTKAACMASTAMVEDSLA